MRARPFGTIRILDRRGYAYIPKMLQAELGVKGKGDVPFYVDANVVLLARKDVGTEEILKGLDLLKNELKLRLENKTGGCR